MARFVSILIAMFFVSIAVPSNLIAVENASWGQIKTISTQNTEFDSPAGKLVVSGNNAGGMRNSRPPSITVFSPNGGESWVLGSTQTIEWKSNNVRRVSLWLCEGNTCGRIGVGTLPETGILNTGSYTFTVGTDVTPFGAYSPSSVLKIRVASEDDYPISTVYDDSDESFNLVAELEIVLVHGTVSIGDVPAPIGTVVDVIDNFGNVAGSCVVNTAGFYGHMKVYRDNPATLVDEGAYAGEWMSIRVDNYVTGYGFQWVHTGDEIEVNIRSVQ